MNLLFLPLCCCRPCTLNFTNIITFIFHREEFPWKVCGMADKISGSSEDYEGWSSRRRIGSFCQLCHRFSWWIPRSCWHVWCFQVYASFAQFYMGPIICLVFIWMSLFILKIPKSNLQRSKLIFNTKDAK